MTSIISLRNELALANRKHVELLNELEDQLGDFPLWEDCWVNAPELEKLCREISDVEIRKWNLEFKIAEEERHQKLLRIWGFLTPAVERLIAVWENFTSRLW